MRLKNFKIKHNLLDFTLADIQNETFEVTKESLVAYWKFIELSDKINQGNYSINNISAVSDSIAFFNVCNAILSYQSCYDYFLQILLFGFGFNSDFRTSKEYRKLIKDECRLSTFDHKEIDGIKEQIKIDSQFTKDLNLFSLSNEEFCKFYSQFKNYYDFRNHNKYGIAEWANCIKHQGGFITEELYNSHRSHNLLFQSADSSESFSSEAIYAHLPSISEILTRLFWQNEKIVEISNWLYETFYPIRKIEAFHTYYLPKDKIMLTKNGTEQDK